MIVRQPLFGFLEIPDSLRKQFVLPKGCVVTKETLELRKRKFLGGNKYFQPITPAMLAGGFTRPTVLDGAAAIGEEEDDGDMEGLPNENLAPFEPLVLWTSDSDPTHNIEVIPSLAAKLRPHQREGVQFLFECTMGLRGFEGEGCILADDMGLGKTLMSITIMWTLLNQGMVKGQSAVRKVMVACPTSLVGNWDNEIRRWVGDGCPTFAVKGSEPKNVIKSFVQHRGKGVLIISYDTQRRYTKMFDPPKGGLNNKGTGGLGQSPSVDLLICDEAHKLKNADAELTKTLNALPARKRILLSGTPMQNELGEFFNMVSFCNPGVLGSRVEFRKRYERPILRSREPDAGRGEVDQANRLQKELSTIVNEFILKRGNTLNARHLPPKLVQFVCCRLTPLQTELYDMVLGSKEIRHIRDGKQTNTLNSIRNLISVCSHPLLVLESYRTRFDRASCREEGDEEKGEGRKASAGKRVGKGVEGGNDGELEALAVLVERHSKPARGGGGGGRGGMGGMGRGGGGLLGGMVRSSIRTALASPAPAPAPTSSSSSSSSSSSAPQSIYASATACQHSHSVTETFHVDPDQSGKLLVLHRMMATLRALKTGERIVVVSNYTQTLDLVETMCKDNNWATLRLGRVR